MLQEPVLQALQLQMAHEFENFQLYKHFSGICDFQSLLGATKWFDIQSQEEYGHFNKFYNYISDKGHIPEMPELKKLEPAIITLDLLFTQTVALEAKTTDNLRLVSEVCKAANDDQTFGLIQWFLNEQISEEKEVQDILKRVLLSSNNLLIIDQELGER